jgi:uncharacterized protein YdhG (YjbR/CyaY superfamily)
MKKTTSPAAVPATIDDYLATVPEPARSSLEKLRAVIRSVVPPGTIETISYRIPTFKYKGMLVGFAAFTRHCSFFVMSNTLLDDFRDDVKAYSTTNSAIHFTPDKPLPPALVKKLVKARIRYNERKKSSQSQPK